MNQYRVPYKDFAGSVGHSESALVGAFTDVLRSGQYVGGPNLDQFENEFAEYVGAAYSTGLANGTCSLHLVLRALNVSEGDEVITAPNSFFASAAAIGIAGAKVVFADVGHDGNLNPAAVEDAISPRTVGIMPVHLTGRPVDMPRLEKIAKRHSLFILEDAAQTVGARFGEHRVGSWGTAATFSFHPLKNLHAFGDGGMLTSNSLELIESVSKLKNHGLSDRSTCEQWSFNCRLDEMQASFLRVQLEGLDDELATRRDLAGKYNAALSRVVEVPWEGEYEFHTYQTFQIRTDRRDGLQSYLREEGVEALVHYPTPLHLQPSAAGLPYSEGSFPEAEAYARETLSLPIFGGMTADQQEYVVEKVVAYLD